MRTTRFASSLVSITTDYKTARRVCIAATVGALTFGATLMLSAAALAADTPVATRAINIAILPIDTDDSDAQAELVTEQLRARVGTLPGVTVVQTPQTLPTATTALRCAAKPDVACQTKIADLIKADRYFWGTAKKIKAKNVVEIELHYYERGKPDFRQIETVAVGTTDAKDANIVRLLDRARLAVGVPTGEVQITYGTQGCTVTTDDGRSVTLVNGKASLEMSPGEHSFQVAAPCAANTVRATVTLGGQSSVEFQPIVAGPVAAVTPKKPFPTKTVVGVGLIAIGAGSAVVGLLQYGAYSSSQRQLRDEVGPSVPEMLRAAGPGKAVDICESQRAAPLKPAIDGAVKQLCADGVRQSTIAWTAGGVAVALIGVGTYLVATGGSSKPADEAPKKATIRISPQLGAVDGVLVSGTF
jgi:hypothetical protein